MKKNIHSLFQLSLSSALAEGIYTPALSIGDLKSRGNFGIGTFENLDGELIAVDGIYYRANDKGRVEFASDQLMSPFAVVTHFWPTSSNSSLEVKSLDDLKEQFASFKTSNNYYYALKISGSFENISFRSIYKSQVGIKLKDATLNQPEFSIDHISGQLIGFWSPAFATRTNISGLHLHFLSDDKEWGGHLLDFCHFRGQLDLQEIKEVTMLLPDNDAFRMGDLSQDPSADLKQAESAKAQKVPRTFLQRKS